LRMALSDYGNPSYWDERYAKHFDVDDQAVFDWYQDYKALKPLIQPHLTNAEEFEILIPGCGNSSLGADLYDDGFVNITNIDVSAVVINYMSTRYASREEMEFTVMNATKMDFLPDDCFNMVIDKALLDAQLCGENNFQNISEMVNEIYRVLKPGGVYVVVSYGVPATRMGYLKTPNLNWDVSYKSIPKPEVEGYSEMGADPNHYIYFCENPI